MLRKSESFKPSKRAPPSTAKQRPFDSSTSFCKISYLFHSIVTYKPFKNDNEILYFCIFQKKKFFHHAIITLLIPSIELMTTFSVNKVFKIGCRELQGDPAPLPSTSLQS